jgi:hypothetical protein
LCVVVLGLLFRVVKLSCLVLFMVKDSAVQCFGCSSNFGFSLSSSFHSLMSHVSGSCCGLKSGSNAVTSYGRYNNTSSIVRVVIDW